MTILYSEGIVWFDGEDAGPFTLIIVPGSLFIIKESEVEKSVLGESTLHNEEGNSMVDMNEMNESIEYADGNSYS